MDRLRPAGSAPRAWLVPVPAVATPSLIWTSTFITSDQRNSTPSPFLSALSDIHAGFVPSVGCLKIPREGAHMLCAKLAMLKSCPFTSTLIS